ncbi:MAG TPA: methyltransferase [Pyrinomonadaceae bacterium]
MSKANADELPLRLGSDEEFARVRSLFVEEGFDEESIGRILKLEEMADLSSVDTDKADLADVPERLAFLIRFFLFVQTMPLSDARRALSPEELAALEALDLLRVADFDAERCYSPAFLYPVAGCLIASDRRNNPDGSPFQESADIVFPAINVGTLLFLRVMSKSPARDALDIGAGSGVAALVLSRNAARVVATDITPRATHFAEFNRRLNDCPNVETVTGDMYEPVSGQTFERIVTHPPYVPALGDKIVYREGGATGEVLVRRAVEGLPEHLRAGGTFYCLCLGHDTREAAFEQRVRGWLGDAEREFDVIFALGEAKTVKAFLAEIILKKGAKGVDIEPLERALAEAGTTRLVYGALVIHRRAADSLGEPWTTRPELSKTTDGANFERALGWHRRASRPGFLEAMADARPRLSESLQVKITHVVRDGELVVGDLMFESEYPFPVKTRVDYWILPLVASFDGTRTVSELYESARAAQAIPDTFELKDFVALVATLVERGYLSVDETFIAG